MPEKSTDDPREETTIEDPKSLSLTTQRGPYHWEPLKGPKSKENIINVKPTENPLNQDP